GDGRSAAHLGCIASRDGVEAAARLLEVVARRGSQARARDVVTAENSIVFRAVIADLIIHDGAARSESRFSDAVGPHQLRDGTFAYGVGLAFGHADATSLQRLTEAAEAAGASGVRASPGRLLMVVGLTQQTASSFAAAAEALGFIVRSEDPRRHVVACAGAPISASADIAARAIAPQIAAAAAPHLDGSFKIHISGCAKGCAHPVPAALTVVGTAAGCVLIADGSVQDTAFKTVATNELPGAVGEIARGLKHEDTHV